MTSSWSRERHSFSNQYQQCSVQDAVSNLVGTLKRLIHKGLLEESDSKWVQTHIQICSLHSWVETALNTSQKRLFNQILMMQGIICELCYLKTLSL